LGSRHPDFCDERGILNRVRRGSATAISATTVKADCPSSTADDYYFGPNELHPYQDAAGDKRLRYEASQFLTTAGLKSLSCGSSRDTYRFIWLPANRSTIIATAVDAGEGRWEFAGVTFVDPRETDLSKWTERLRVQQRTSRVRSQSETTALWQTPCAGELLDDARFEKWRCRGRSLMDY